MSSSTTTAIADAIVSALNGRTWSPTFTAKRWTEPRYSEVELATLRVSVVARGRDAEIETRGSDRKTHTIWVCVQKRLADINSAALVDPLDKLVEDLQDYLLGAAFSGATCIEVKTVLAGDTLVAQEHLAKNVYTSAFICTLIQ